MAGIFDAIGGVVGGLFDADNSKRAAQRQYHKEKEFAQNSILWRVEDANRAGIHPLYAMGNPGIQAGPSPYGGSNFAAAGQNIGRAIDAMRTRGERQQAELEARAANNLINQRTQAEIEHIRAQTNSEIARLQDFQRGPPSPSIKTTSAMSAIAGDAGLVDPQPARPVVASKSNPAREAGSITSYGFMRTPGGGLAVVPSKDAKERTEDDIIQQLGWNLKHTVLPAFSGLRPPNTKQFPLPRGQSWRWFPPTQEFMPFDNRTRKYVLPRN